MVFRSKSIRNDDGLATALESVRRLTYGNGSLKYRLEMSTNEVAQSTQHLEAELSHVTDE